MTCLADIDPAVQVEIQAHLDAIEADNGVRILFAIESGSRAWGFPSPDSDYDVRFVYVHSLDYYLSLDSQRDVIELPISDDLDINGWELRKTLNLMLKPNPVLMEWLRSPIVYRKNTDAFDALSELSMKAEAATPSRYHYLHLGQRQYKRSILGRETAKLKSYFYALRPALALRHLRLRPGVKLPMNIHDLIADCDLPTDIDRLIADLISKKSETKELGYGEPISLLDSFLEDEFRIAEKASADQRPDHEHLHTDAETLFRRLVLESE